MERTTRTISWLQRAAPVAGDAGGLLFFAYYTARARAVELPVGWAALLDLSTAAMVGIAVLGYQLAQGASAKAWIGWAAVGAIGLGFGGTLSLVCAGLALFGVAMVRCGVHPRLPGLLLVSGGAVLLVAQAFAPGFGRAVSGTSPAWGVLMGLALVAVAGALADLDVLHRESAAHAHR